MNYQRRKTRKVMVGRTPVGGENPIVVQTMTNTDTLDTEATARQIKRCAEAGAKLVRMTAQGVRHARNLADIREALNRMGVEIDLVADIHFNPKAAFEAALHVEKVRINPGNFVETTGATRSPSDQLEEALVPLLDLCRRNGTALRIGVNHGSLSERIMRQYGDTPEGMVESAMEFLRIAARHDFHDIIVSIKASNVVVMTRTVRLMAATMDAEGLNYPLHLGVTEAGDGEDGRVKSAVGIGSLLADGLGDTIRVSLSEAPEAEIPVAEAIIEHIDRRATGAEFVSITTGADESDELPSHILVVGHDVDKAVGKTMKATYPSDWDYDRVTVAAAIDLGMRLLDGASDSDVRSIAIEAPGVDADKLTALALTILQATRRRISRTEYIACPGCGRTMFDLQTTLARVRQATSHLKGLKIGVMGCIVNGPGEMADADYGYVGGARGCVSLYRGKECVERNIPAADAVDALLRLIENDKQRLPLT